MDNTKKYITSLLTSTPLAVTIQQLNKDYRNTIGEYIPYHKFGFNSLEHFLRSIPETVRIRGCGPLAEVLPVVSEKSSHVMQLVSNQKKNGSKRRDQYYGKRTVVFDHQKQNSQKQYQQPLTDQKTRIHYPGQSNSGPIEISKPPDLYSANKNNTRPEPTENISNDNHQNALPTPKKNERLENSTQNPNPASNDDNPVSKLVKPLENLKFVNVEKNEKPVGYSKLADVTKPSAKSHRKKLHQSEKVKPPLSENFDNAIPQSIQSNLRKLIGHYPNGIWCANIPVVYRQMFNRELKYEEFGFKSLIHLCTSLKSIFHYVRPSNEDFKLYDRSKPLPSSAEKVFTIASYGDGGKTEKGSGTALPKIDWEDVIRYLPPCTFKPGQEIPRAFVPELTSENDTIDIKVGEIYDLSKFWIYLDDGMLDLLMDEMQVFYNEHAKDYIIPPQLVREGLYCAHIFFGEYHRALVVDVVSPPKEMVRVVFIDYGTVAKVPIEDLCFLHENFSHLPAQAIRCRLGNICPPEKGAAWKRESTKAFRQLILQKDLIAKIIRINWKDQFLEVCLADVTDGNGVFYIHDILVEKGFAIYPNQEQKKSIIDSISTPVVSLIHLFPTFLEIEHGLAPSTSEMEVFHDLNVPINFCYPQYFKLECDEEEKIIKLAVAFHESYCMKEGRMNSIHSKYIMNKEQMKPDRIDMAYFGQLESEVLAYCEYEIPDEEDLSKSLQDDFDYVEAQKSKTIDKLRQDCLISQDIMKEILSICDNNDRHKNDEIRPEDLHTSKDEVIDDRNTPIDMDISGDFYTPAGSPSHGNIEQYFGENLDETEIVENNACNQIFSERHAAYDLTVPEKSESECIKLSNKLENSESSVRNQDETKSYCYSSTNPFLEDLNAAGEEKSLPSDTIPRLNPNNPFLTYLIRKSQDDCSDGSDNSTVYDYVEEVIVPQKWSTNDERSSDTSVSCDSGSSSSINTKNVVKSCAISTQTSDEDVESGQTLQNYPFNPSSYNSMFMPTFATHPNWCMSFSNPYYSTKFSPCGYYPPESRFCSPLSSIQGIGFGVQNRFPPRPAICPPPGFAPRGNFSRGSGDYILTVNDMGPRNLNGSVGSMYNCVPRIATLSNVSVASERDFYEMYNEQLRLKIHPAPSD